MDRIDIHVEVPAVRHDELASRDCGELSERVRVRMRGTRGVQARRFGGEGIYTNARMDASNTVRHCGSSTQARRLLKEAMEKLSLSARAYHRILRVARTIADLEGAEAIETHHMAEAIQYRSLDREMS